MPEVEESHVIGCEYYIYINYATRSVFFGDDTFSVFTSIFVVLGMRIVVLVTTNSTFAAKVIPLGLWNGKIVEPTASVLKNGTYSHSSAVVLIVIVVYGCVGIEPPQRATIWRVH